MEEFPLIDFTAAAEIDYNAMAAYEADLGGLAYEPEEDHEVYGRVRNLNGEFWTMLEAEGFWLRHNLKEQSSKSHLKKGQNGYFRIHTERFFVTISKCPIPKEYALELLQLRFGKENILEYVIGEEDHKDGTPHIHIHLKMAKTLVCDCRFLDMYYEGKWYHGKLLAVKSIDGNIFYCGKGFNYLASFDLQAKKYCSKNHKKFLGEDLIAGRTTLPEACEKNPSLIFEYLKMEQNVNAFNAARAGDAMMLPFLIPNPWEKLMISNITDKKRHYWIWSNTPNKGKTTWALSMVEKFGVLLVAGDLTYWNVTGGERMIIIDEMNDAKDIRYNHFNSMCDGTYQFRIFQNGVKKVRNKPIYVVLSNHSIDMMYPFASRLLHARFNEYCID